ncbi:hypothetical protein ASB1_03540 [Helicobacter heilmannii]|nr:hypothetical protein [Helicobacter heilmannii]BDQ26678.1 hypothetical protein ASB1_03540 [Helicobacter heilmannii]
MDALFLAFCAAAWVFVCANVLLSVATFGLLSVPFFGLSLSGVVVGLFGG